ncbi:hypothetical protein [Paludibacter sp. 221]|uniref:hypothetical protein n=1 Tax=Paludibacter sp. 221 TaxID=2302939 RepID=UPI0013D321E1|nr:hypothetical protein [Paludibacter sp. 221]
MKIELKKIVNPSIGLIFLYVIIGTLIWGITYVGAFFHCETGFNDVLFKLPDTDFLWKNIVSFVFTVLNSILLSHLINRFSFVSSRTFLPVFIFSLLIAVWEPAHIMYQSHIALMLFIVALFQFFNMYHDRAAMEKAFLGSLLIAASSLLINDLIFVIPVCWLGFLVLRSLSYRTFLASTIGAVVPWIIYAAIRYFISPDIVFADLFNLTFSLGFSMEGLQLPTKIYIGLLLAIFLITLIGTYADFRRNGSITRKNINFILTLLIYFVVVFFFQDSFNGTVFPFIALCFAIFISNVFSTKQTNFYSILFIVFLVLNMAFVVYNFMW